MKGGGHVAQNVAGGDQAADYRANHVNAGKGKYGFGGMNTAQGVEASTSSGLGSSMHRLEGLNGLLDISMNRY